MFLKRLHMGRKLKLGFDNYTLRSFDWKARQLIEYAASLDLDTVLLSDPNVFVSHDEAHLKEIRTSADDLGIELQVGMLSICPGSKLFDRRRGTAEEQLKLTLRIARTLEDPLQNLEALGPYALTTGIRDSVVWETADGAMLQWTTLGEGSVDWKRYFKRFTELCPGAPVQLEIISGRQTLIPYLRDDFWDAYPKARIRELMRFVSFAKRGSPQTPFTVPTGSDARRAEQEFQRVELERSVRYCKEVLGLGLK